MIIFVIFAGFLPLRYAVAALRRGEGRGGERHTLGFPPPFSTTFGKHWLRREFGRHPCFVPQLFGKHSDGSKETTWGSSGPVAGPSLLPA